MKSESYPGSAASRPQKQWHSHGYLPHFEQPDLVKFVTFRLCDSLPAEIVREWKAGLHLYKDTRANDPRMVGLRERIARYEDAGYGACLLRDERVAEIVQTALFYFDDERYRLLAWCIMPNHVHALAECGAAWPLGGIVHSWKSFTAKAANRVLGRTGEFWMPDYHDRFIRDQNHLQAAIEYVEQNPVKAGLCRQPEEWSFSSARPRRILRNGRPDASSAPIGIDDSALPHYD